MSVADMSMAAEDLVESLLARLGAEGGEEGSTPSPPAPGVPPAPAAASGGGGIQRLPLDAQSLLDMPVTTLDLDANSRWASALVRAGAGAGVPPAPAAVASADAQRPSPPPQPRRVHQRASASSASAPGQEGGTGARTGMGTPAPRSPARTSTPRRRRRIKPLPVPTPERRALRHPGHTGVECSAQGPPASSSAVSAQEAPRPAAGARGSGEAGAVRRTDPAGSSPPMPMSKQAFIALHTAASPPRRIVPFAPFMGEGGLTHLTPPRPPQAAAGGGATSGAQAASASAPPPSPAGQRKRQRKSTPVQRRAKVPRQGGADAPPGLPPGWSCHTSVTNGRTYFFNASTGQSTFDASEVFGAAAERQGRAQPQGEEREPVQGDDPSQAAAAAPVDDALLASLLDEVHGSGK